MADGAYVRVSAKYGDDGIYESPLFDYVPDDFDVPEPTAGYARRLTVGTSLQTLIPLGTFTALQTVAVKNNDNTNYVELRYSYTDAALAVFTNCVKVAPGGIAVLPGGIDVGTNVQAQAFGAAVELDVAVIGQ